MLWVTLISVALAATFYYWKKCNEVWRNKCVPQTNPLPLFGDSFYIFFKLQSIGDFVRNLTQNATGKRYLGLYQFLKPTLAITDPDLIKQIAIKDFDHFTDHQGFINPETDPLFGKNLFSLKAKQWHQMRVTISPSFTSSKMKLMYSLIQETADHFAEFFVKQNKKSIELNMRDTFTRFTNDVIASTAFGLKIDSLENPENEFYLMGKEVTNLNGFAFNLKLMFSLVFPRLCKLFDISLLGTRISTYFLSIVRNNVNQRREKNIIRPDIIHLLMEAQKGRLQHEEEPNMIDTGFATVQEELESKKDDIQMEITDEDIAAQAMAFFFAGFDAVSNLMCFTAYELAMNPEIQTRLREEINETKGDITYEALLKMEYLDMVITESLRKWPNAVLTDRLCTKPYTIQPTRPDERAIHINKGDLLWFPIYGIHHDPQYYPDPDRFDPERFSAENKSTINQYAYLPFGVGPRNCIGSRFALLEAKAIFVSILREFEITVSPRMKVPLKLDAKSFNMSAEGGFWLNFNRLEN